MKNTLLLGLAFILGNFLLFQFHLWLFKSSIPFIGWATGLVHIFLLIIFPYSKFFSSEKR